MVLRYSVCGATSPISNMRRVRAKAEKALGNDFDIRKFHDVVLSLGSVPLPALEARIDAFIADGGQGLSGVTYD